MLKIALCDDDIGISHDIEKYINSLDIGSKSLEVFNHGYRLQQFLTINNESFNIYLLDIEMPEVSGIELAKYIRQKDTNAVIIFITSHKEYVYDVFEVLPFRFLCKPLQPNDLKRALADAAEYLRRDNQIFSFHKGHDKYQIPFGEIICFEGAARKIRICSVNGTEECYGQISKVMDLVDKKLFIRVHGSYIVNLEHIRIIRRDEVEMVKSLCIPVSRRYQNDLKLAHINFLKWKGGI